MGKISINDWQTIQTGKNVQLMQRFLRGKNSANWSVAIDVALVIVAFSLSNIFQSEPTKVSTIWLICSIAVVLIPLIIVIASNLKAKNIRTQSKFMKGKQDLIDLFDNDICYNIMTADSLYDLAQGYTTAILPRDLHVERFYYVEASYYLNKAVTQLWFMKNTLNNVISSSESQSDLAIASNKGISLMRFINVLEIIHETYLAINTNLKNRKEMFDILKSNMGYIDKIYNKFVDEAMQVFTECKSSCHIIDLKTLI